MNDIENKLRRLERALEALTESAANTEAYCAVIFESLPHLLNGDPEKKRQIQHRTMRDFQDKLKQIHQKEKAT